MAYKQVIQNMALSPSDKQALIREFDLLRAEIDDIRTKYGAVMTALDAETLSKNDYAAGATTVLKAAQFKAI